MDVKQFRIGNYLNDREGNLCEVIKLGKDSIYAPAINKATTKIPNIPIPLTEEWLLKFGFNFDGIDWQFPEDSVYFIGWYAGKWCLGTQSDGVLKETYFEYVHELQNLFCALKGVELKTQQEINSPQRAALDENFDQSQTTEYCICDFVMVERNPNTDEARCFTCKKPIKE